MKKIIIYKQLILALAMLFVSVELYAANDEAQYNTLKKEYTLNADGSYSLRVVKQITLYTHTAFNSLYGETFIVYNPDYETLKINESYTTLPDGTVIQAPENAFNEVLPSFAVSAVEYNHLKEMVVTHTGLEIGATIYLDYTLTTKPSANGKRYFDIEEIIEESSPVKEYTISIEAPKSLGVKYALFNSTQKPKVEGDKVTYTFKNVKPSAIESFKPENSTAPVLVASAMPKGFMEQTFGAKYSGSDLAELTSLVNNEVVTSSSNEEKVSEILSYLTSRIQTSRVPYSYQNNETRALMTVVNSGYATSMERVALMRAMLLIAEVDYSVLVSSADYISLEMLSLARIKNILFNVNGKYYSAFVPTAIEIAPRSGMDNFYTLEGSKFTQTDVESKTVINSTSEVEISKDMANNGSYIIYKLENKDSKVMNWRISGLPATRVSNFELPELIDSEKISWEISLAEGVELQSKEFSIERKESFGEFSISTRVSGDKVVVEREVKFNTQTISPKEYSKFREFMTQLNSSKYSTLLFEAK